MPRRPRSSPAARIGVTGAAAIAVVAALLPVPTASAGVPPASSPPVASAPASSAPVAAGAIAWGTCEDVDLDDAGAECAVVRVPLDHAKPKAKKVAIAISRIAATATGSAYQGPLVVAAEPSVLDVLDAAAGLGEQVVAAYDLIAFDQRGFDASGPKIACPPALAAPTPDYEPTDPGRIVGNEKARLTASRAYAKSCGKANGERLEHVSSADAAADLESIRAALGAPKLSLLMRGYGTYLGQLYASSHPARVHRMVLGGPDHPRGETYRVRESRPVGLDGALRRFFDWIARNDAYFGIGASADAVEAAYEQQRDALAGRPVQALGPAEWTLSLRNLAALDEAGWPLVAHAWSQLRSGNPAPMLSLVEIAATPDEFFDAAVAAQECSDDRFPRSYQRMREDAARAAALAPLTGWSELWKNNARCAPWPVRGRLAAIDGSTAPPALVIAGAAAASGSPSNARAARREFPRSSLVLVAGSIDSYGEVLLGNECVDRAVDAYLLTGELPARRGGDGPDATCFRLPEPGPLQIAQAAAQLSLLPLVNAAGLLLEQAQVPDVPLPDVPVAAGPAAVSGSFSPRWHATIGR